MMAHFVCRVSMRCIDAQQETLFDVLNEVQTSDKSTEAADKARMQDNHPH